MSESGGDVIEWNTKEKEEDYSWGIRERYATIKDIYNKAAIVILFLAIFFFGVAYGTKDDNLSKQMSWIIFIVLLGATEAYYFGMSREDFERRSTITSILSKRKDISKNTIVSFLVNDGKVFVMTIGGIIFMHIALTGIIQTEDFYNVLINIPVVYVMSIGPMSLVKGGFIKRAIELKRDCIKDLKMAKDICNHAHRPEDRNSNRYRQAWKKMDSVTVILESQINFLESVAKIKSMFFQAAKLAALAVVPLLIDIMGG